MPEPNYRPLFTRRPFLKGFDVGTANMNRDGAGVVVQVVEAGENGARLDWIGLKATVTTTAGMIRVYVSKVGTGITTTPWSLIGEVATSAATPSGTVTSWKGTWIPDGGYMTLAPGQIVGVSTHNAENVVVSPEGGHF